MKSSPNCTHGRPAASIRGPPHATTERTDRDTFDPITQTRSVKAYDPHHGLTTAEETKLLEAVKPAMRKGGQLALAEVVVQARFV